MLNKITGWLTQLRSRNNPERVRTDAIAALNIPVLCYHSWTMYSTDYAQNDHVALRTDLRTLAARGYEVLPATTLVALLRKEIPIESVRSAQSATNKKLVCLTCDDGRDHDYVDYDHEELGSVPSFHTLLEESAQWLPLHGEGPRAVSFVIAGPQSRAELDSAVGEPKNAWGHDWWEECANKGILGIANHSWDHVHEALQVVKQRDNKKGSFLEIQTFDDAEAQVRQAQLYINSATGNQATGLFGYPYGHVPAYLRDEYLPTYGEELGLFGAFSTAGASATMQSNVWEIPRFVCGYHWKSEQAFNELLDAVEAGER